MPVSQDVKDHIPEDPIADAIYANYKKAGDAEPQRGYLGASIIGHPCNRWLWYNFRQCCSEDISGRIYRLFETGDLEEGRLSRDLESIGCTVHDADGEGEQFEVTALGGHFSGHMDGCALGIPGAEKAWHVMEYKTHNAKSYRRLLGEGVQKSKPQHYAQMQIYMHLTGMTRALYVAKNKDTEEIRTERVKYDRQFCAVLMEKAEWIITATEPPPRISNRRDYYLCSWCDANDICFGTEGLSPKPALPLKTVSCRQCCHATPLLDREGAEWHCAKNGACATNDWVPDMPCKDHLCLPGLFAFATVEIYDSERKTILMKNTDDTTWPHGSDTNSYCTSDLLTLPVDLLTHDTVSYVKSTFGGKVKFSRDPLEKYSEETSRVVWRGPSAGLPAAWISKYKTDLSMQKPIERYDHTPEYDAAEMDGDILIVLWGNGIAEILEGVQ